MDGYFYFPLVLLLFSGSQIIISSPSRPEPRAVTARYVRAGEESGYFLLGTRGVSVAAILSSRHFRATSSTDTGQWE